MTDAAGDTDQHQFDRRSTDVNYKALHERVAILEKTVNEELLPQMGRNTEMTADIHAKNDEMYAAFLTAKNGIKVITKLGNGAVRLSDWVARRAKTFLILAATMGAIWTFLKTGKLPDWAESLFK